METNRKRKPMKPLIIIPTYNEKENISPIIHAVLEKNPQVEILVVDDNSPDGTGQIVKDLRAHNPKVHLLHREQKEGLGKAYIAGFQWGLDKGFDMLVEMDADFSHRPEDLVQLIKSCENSDFAVGSRYIPGGRTVN